MNSLFVAPVTFNKWKQIRRPPQSPVFPQKEVHQYRPSSPGHNDNKDGVVLIPQIREILSFIRWVGLSVRKYI